MVSKFGLMLKLVVVFNKSVCIMNILNKQLQA